MTIIVFDPESNKVRVDRRHTFGATNGRRPYAASKVQSSDRGSKLAFCRAQAKGWLVFTSADDVAHWLED